MSANRIPCALLANFYNILNKGDDTSVKWLPNAITILEIFQPISKRTARFSSNRKINGTMAERN